MSRLQRNHSLNWFAAMKLGASIAHQLDSNYTLDEIAAELGMTRQNVWVVSCVALGKLVWNLQKMGWRP